MELNKIQIEKQQLALRKNEMQNQQMAIQQEIQVLQSMKSQSQPNSQLQQQLDMFKRQYFQDMSQKRQEIEQLKDSISNLRSTTMKGDRMQVTQGQGPEESFQVIAVMDKADKEIHRMDKISLVQKGVRGLLDNKPNQDIDLSLDIQSDKNSALVTFQYLGIWFEQIIGPEKIFTTMNFYNFPQFKSDTMIHGQSKGQKSQSLIVEKMKQSLDDTSQPTYTFQVNFENENFSKYLNEKMLHIEIWNAQSLMLYGFIQIDLRYLLRQGRDLQTCAKEYSIIHPTNGEILGNVHLLLQNRGQHKEKERTNEISGMGHTKNKVTSDKQIQIPQTLDTPSLDEDKRIIERIQKHKMCYLQESIQNQHMDYKAKQILIQKIQNFKNENKKLVIQEVVESFYKDSREVEVEFGKATILQFRIENKFEQEQAYQLQVMDPDDQYSELKIINDPLEWRYLCQQYKYPLPPEWEVISKTNVILLKAKEVVTILLRFQSFRIADFDHHETVKHNFEFLTERQIKVHCNFLKGRIHQGITLNIKPKNNVINQIFRFWQKGSSRVNLHLPALYLKDEPIQGNPFIVCSQKYVTITQNQTNIQLQLKTLENQNIQHISVLAYADKFHYKLLGHWLVEIHCVDHQFLRVHMGQASTLSLQVPSDIKARYCKLYSSSKSVTFPKPFNRQFTLIPGKYHTINAQIKAFNEEEEKIQINCVDDSTQELVYSCILTVIVEQPHVSRIFELNTKANQESAQFILYESRLDKHSNFQFVSSDESVIQIKEIDIPFQPNQAQQVPVKITSSKQGNQNVYIFAQDDQDLIFDCLLIKLQTSYY